MLAFLDEFAPELSRPIIPDNRQHIEYAPTQVLTEYLRWAPRNKIDGIELRSSQTNESTYVLFVDSNQISEDDPDAPIDAHPQRLLLDGIAAPDEALAFKFDSSQVAIYRVNRRVEPTPVSTLVFNTWVTVPSQDDAR